MLTRIRTRLGSHTLFTLLGVALATTVFASVTVAQPRKGPRPKAPERSAPEKAEEAPREDVLSDAGDAPVARPEGYGDGGIRPSPLTPAPREFPKDVDGGAAPPDYDKIMSDIALLRARVAAVSNTMFHSRIAVSIQIDSDASKVGRLYVSLDDGVVFTAPEGFHPSDLQPVFEQAVAPGKHAVTVDVERRDLKDESFRHEERTRFLVDVPKDHRSQVDLVLSDGSTMGADFSADKKGKYDVKWRANVVARPVSAGGSRK